MIPILESLFAHCVELGASDVHLSVDEPPRFRVQGQLAPRPEFAPFDARTVDEIAMELGLYTLPLGCPDGTELVRKTLVRDGAIDGAVTAPDGQRYRFNLFRQQDRTSVALRRLDAVFRSLPELGLPPRIADFCRERDGLVIVTGPTGSGKSTTLATLIDGINATRECFIVTIEDPIEFEHASRRALVNQRQVGRDARSFNDALVEAMRQDPDVILVGEIRDVETVRTALRAAETGHLVFTTLHAGDCPGAVERIISVFPADEQNSVRRQLAMVLRGIVAQHLMVSVDGSRRHAVAEVLVNTTGVANLIATGRTAQIASAIETGGNVGMRSLEESLAELLFAGAISERDAFLLTRNPETLQRRLYGDDGE
ncbi:MAG: PilT/PilU family type 4a pilus ATPase [Kiritimatiellae bacterium]|nr:PilT/PilU family type 4a pilus ATPase [Kiritimatiellia bacterium]